MTNTLRPYGYVLLLMETIGVLGCTHVPMTEPADAAVCVGSAALPVAWVDQLEPVSDPALLAQAIGPSNQGGLCQGQVYRSKANSQVALFRVWNSTHPASEMGQWWAWNKPEGLVAHYRRDYAICYEWSPLDTLTQCQLKPGMNVVIGTGQSIRCSPHFSYEVSAQQQIFISNASTALENCRTFEATFQWR